MSPWGSSLWEGHLMHSGGSAGALPRPATSCSGHGTVCALPWGSLRGISCGAHTSSSPAGRLSFLHLVCFSLLVSTSPALSSLIHFILVIPTWLLRITIRGTPIYQNRVTESIPSSLL